MSFLDLWGSHTFGCSVQFCLTSADSQHRLQFQTPWSQSMLVRNVLSLKHWDDMLHNLISFSLFGSQDTTSLLLSFGLSRHNSWIYLTYSNSSIQWLIFKKSLAKVKQVFVHECIFLGEV
jgi:hypothetical protein